MENIEIPSGALILRSALQMLYPDRNNSHASLLLVVDRNDPQLEPVCQPESVILEPASLQISSLEAH